MCYYTQPFVVAIFPHAINGAFINLTTFVVHLLLPVGVVDLNGNSPATVLTFLIREIELKNLTHPTFNMGLPMRCNQKIENSGG